MIHLLKITPFPTFPQACLPVGRGEGAVSTFPPWGKMKGGKKLKNEQYLLSNRF
jgi:hypothetical protein